MLSKPVYSVTGFIGSDDMTAHVIIDKKNNSIHIHFYSKMFGNKRTPISVKHFDAKFPESDEIDLVKEIINGELPTKQVKINEVTLLKEKELPTNQGNHPHRIIIRYEK